MTPRGFSAFQAIFRAPPGLELSASFQSPRWRRVLFHRGLLHNLSSAMLPWTFSLKDRDNNNNNNNNTIWGGSVLTGEEPPTLWRVEACSPPSIRPNRSQLSRPMSSGHHISMEHRLRKKQLNADNDASNKTYLKEIQEKRKRRNFFLQKK